MVSIQKRLALWGTERLILTERATFLNEKPFCCVLIVGVSLTFAVSGVFWLIL